VSLVGDEAAATTVDGVTVTISTTATTCTSVSLFVCL